MPLRLSPRALVLLAFGSVYLFWGSTYAAIRVAGEHLPSPAISAVRCLITTLVLALLVAGGRKRLRVARGEGWKLALVGGLFMSANSMLLNWAETMVPSGFASLVVSTTPIMIALLEMGLPDGEALNGRGWAGTLLGTLGIGVLVWPSLHGGVHGASGETHPALGIAVLLLAALCFAVGSVLSRRFHFQTDTLVATAWQLGAATIVNIAIMLLSGSLRHAEWSYRGVAALVYLAIFGSVFGLVAFTYLLQHVPVTKVATYAFVNPVIAVLLGVFLLGERLVHTEVIGMAVIVCAVALVVLSRTQRRKPVLANEILEAAGEAVP